MATRSMTSHIEERCIGQTALGQVTKTHYPGQAGAGFQLHMIATNSPRVAK